MIPLEIQEAQAITAKAVQAIYSERHSPIPGAILKPAIEAEAAKEGKTLLTKSLGFKGFSDFVLSVPGLTVQRVLGSDFLVTPSTGKELLPAFAEPLPKIRRDLWKAFVEFPRLGIVRLYDRDEDKILFEPAETSKEGIPINSVSQDEHLEWRREFAIGQPDEAKNLLLSSLDKVGGQRFVEYARRLRENPALIRTWNRFFQKKISDRITEWASSNRLSEDRWRAAPKSPFDAVPLSQRAELYNLFDQLPIEELLHLRVPLEWLLKIRKSGR